MVWTRRIFNTFASFAQDRLVVLMTNILRNQKGKSSNRIRRGYWYDLCELKSELIIPRYATFEISGDWDEDVRAYNGESDDN